MLALFDLPKLIGTGTDSVGSHHPVMPLIHRRRGNDIGSVLTCRDQIGRSGILELEHYRVVSEDLDGIQRFPYIRSALF